jgi:hypothetical protein
MLDKMDFDACLDHLDLPEQGSNKGYSSSQLIKQFITSVWCGANKFEHTEVTRHDEVIRQFWNYYKLVILQETLAVSRFNAYLKI